MVLPPGIRIRPPDWGFERPDLLGTRPVRTLASARVLEAGAPPIISQRNQGTPFDEVACGPTCLVMAGVTWGIIPRSASVRAAIMAAGRWGSTGQSGTTVEGLGRIAEGMGIDFEQRPYVSAAGVRDFLRLGAHVVARGNSYALPWSDPAPEPDAFSGHVVYIVGEDDQGRFIVHDPYVTDGAPRYLTDAELERFGERHDFRDKPFIMGVAKLQPGVKCRSFLPGVG